VYFAALTRQLLARFAPFQQNLNIPPATLAATFTKMERRVGLYLQVEGKHFPYLLQTHYLHVYRGLSSENFFSWVNY
jgi:hypothetical protein